MVSQLKGQKEDNILPEEDDDTKLTEQFDEFFLNKIINIRKLHNIPPYKTQKDAIPRFDKFSMISKANLKPIINQMPKKSCQFDILNTSTLKKVIDMCIPTITRVINLSLDRGGFCVNLKSAVMKPLIKSKQKGTTKSNYQPVSNLSFISKVDEKCTLE